MTDNNFHLFSEYSKARNRHLRDTIFLANDGLIHHTIHKYFSNCELSYEDLYFWGCEGLLKAIDHYDITKGVKFSTLAVRCIFNLIARKVKQYYRKSSNKENNLVGFISLDGEVKDEYIDKLDSGENIEEEIEEKELLKVALELYNNQKSKLTPLARNVADNYFIYGMDTTRAGISANTNQSYAHRIVKKLNSNIRKEFLSLM